MKMPTIPFCLLSLLSLISHAGTPSQDPAVASMREIFSSAHVPAPQDLDSTSWSCTMRSVETGNNYFTSFDDGYQFKADIQRGNPVIRNDGRTNIRLFEFRPLIGLVGILAPDPSLGRSLGQEVIRITDDKKLVIEYSVLNYQAGGYKLETSPVANLPNGYHVGEYAICQQMLN